MVCGIRIRMALLFAAAGALSMATNVRAGDFTVEKTEDGVVVRTF